MDRMKLERKIVVATCVLAMAACVLSAAIPAAAWSTYSYFTTTWIDAGDVDYWSPGSYYAVQGGLGFSLENNHKTRICLYFNPQDTGKMRVGIKSTDGSYEYLTTPIYGSTVEVTNTSGSTRTFRVVIRNNYDQSVSEYYDGYFYYED